MTLTEVFERKDDIANRVRTELVHVMGHYGYIIDDVLVPNVQPDNKVVQAMNEKNASEQPRSSPKTSRRSCLHQDGA